MSTFSADFLWGVSTAAYQIEGAHDADGKGPSIWDAFTSRPGTIRDGHDARIACDHYHRWAEDIRLMKALGVKAYRLSLSWPRVLPAGVGRVNDAGLAFYDQLIDGLLDAGIAPYVTLFHWDLPLALHHRGGWLNPDSPTWFEEYARVVANRLGDRVPGWMTLNEPQVFMTFGYGTGVNAPGLQLPEDERIRMGHHVLVAHGRAVAALRTTCTNAPQVGFAPQTLVNVPASDARDDCDAAREAMFASAANPLWSTAWWLDPALLGHYPEDGLARFGQFLPDGWAHDLPTIAQPIDFLGANIYSGMPTRRGAAGRPEFVGAEPGHMESLFRWLIRPDCLYWGPKFLHERYHLPIIITENGMSNVDWIHKDGRCHDPQRIDMLARSLAELRRAHLESTDVRGYLHWSLMDNFEWAEGYHQRFGLVHVDFQTLKRTPKDSFDWYREVISTRGASLGE